MIKNFINIRVQVAKKLSIRHNISSKNDRSLSTDDNSQNNLYFDFDKNEVIEINESNEKYLQKKHTKQYNANNDSFVKSYYQRTNRKSKATNRGNIEGVITFSESIDKDLDTKYSKKELFEIALNTIEDIAKQWDTSINYLVLHLDEKRPHFHFSLFNFDNSEDGYSLIYKKRFSKDLSSLQDIAYSHFKKLDMSRGLKKATTKVNHQSIKRYYEKELNNAKFKANELDTLTQLVFNGFSMLEDSEDINELKETRQTIKDYKADNKELLTKEQITTLNFLMRSCTQKTQNKKIKNLDTKKQDFYKTLEQNTLIELENNTNIFNNISLDSAKEIVIDTIETTKKKNELELLEIDKKSKMIETKHKELDAKNNYLNELNKKNEIKIQELKNIPQNELKTQLKNKDNHINSLNMNNNRLNNQLVDLSKILELEKKNKIQAVENIKEQKNQELKKILENQKKHKNTLLHKIKNEAYKVLSSISKYREKKEIDISSVIKRLSSYKIKNEIIEDISI